MIRILSHEELIEKKLTEHAVELFPEQNPCVLLDDETGEYRLRLRDATSGAVYGHRVLGTIESKFSDMWYDLGNVVI